ncbi:MAG: hypothetical protein AB1894_00375 [Chloroflexota bacterium]
MKDPILFRRSDTLDPVEAGYWKDLLYRVAKIGAELEVAPPKGMSRPEFEGQVRQDLAPSGTLERLGANGVLDVQPEHCGIEIRIIGRQPHFRSLQRQYQTIMKVLWGRGSRSRPTCGLHFHLLTPTLAEPVPEIILANLWNLTRRYGPELKFLTSGGDCRAGLCRRRQHNSHLEFVRHSSGVAHMSKVQQALKESLTVPEHQNFLNLEHIGFSECGAVLPFHLEFRFPDVDLSATSVASKTFLFLALLLKSVDLSQYGVIHVGRIQAWQRKKHLLDMLSNNEGNLATSDTRAVDDATIEELRQGCYEMLDLLAPTFERFANNPALDVLLALAERPISLLRCAGYDWAQVEELLAERALLNPQGLDETDRKLMQRIELGEWAGKPSCEAWKWRAAQELYLTPQDLDRRLQRIELLRGVRWDERQGTMVFTS